MIRTNSLQHRQNALLEYVPSLIATVLFLRDMNDLLFHAFLHLDVVVHLRCDPILPALVFIKEAQQVCD